MEGVDTRQAKGQSQGPGEGTGGTAVGMEEVDAVTADLPGQASQGGGGETAMRQRQHALGPQADGPAPAPRPGGAGHQALDSGWQGSDQVVEVLRPTTVVGTTAELEDAERHGGDYGPGPGRTRALGLAPV